MHSGDRITFNIPKNETVVASRIIQTCRFHFFLNQQQQNCRQTILAWTRLIITLLYSVPFAVHVTSFKRISSLCLLNPLPTSTVKEYRTSSSNLSSFFSLFSGFSFQAMLQRVTYVRFWLSDRHTEFTVQLMTMWTWHKTNYIHMSIRG